MKKIYILALLACLTCSSTIFAGIKPAKKTSSSYQQSRNVSNFNGIAAGGSLDIKVSMGNTESLRMEGDPEAIAELIVEVNNGILEIKPKNKWNDWYKQFKESRITVYISAKKLNSLTLSGSGILTVNGVLNSKDLSTSISGSGVIKTQVNVENFKASISGSGRVLQTGKAKQANISLSGSGAFVGRYFNTDYTRVSISGSGRAEVLANQGLNAAVSGSGRITYYGDAPVQKKVSGSGSIQKG